MPVAITPMRLLFPVLAAVLLGACRSPAAPAPPTSVALQGTYERTGPLPAPFGIGTVLIASSMTFREDRSVMQRWRVRTAGGAEESGERVGDYCVAGNRVVVRHDGPRSEYGQVFRREDGGRLLRSVPEASPVGCPYVTQVGTGAFLEERYAQATSAAPGG